jgi:hypothetical protein
MNAFIEEVTIGGSIDPNHCFTLQTASGSFSVQYYDGGEPGPELVAYNTEGCQGVSTLINNILPVDVGQCFGTNFPYKSYSQNNLSH